MVDDHVPELIGAGDCGRELENESDDHDGFQWERGCVPRAKFTSQVEPVVDGPGRKLGARAWREVSPWFRGLNGSSCCGRSSTWSRLWGCMEVVGGGGAGVEKVVVDVPDVTGGAEGSAGGVPEESQQHHRRHSLLHRNQLELDLEIWKTLGDRGGDGVGGERSPKSHAVPWRKGSEVSRKTTKRKKS